MIGPFATPISLPMQFTKSDRLWVGCKWSARIDRVHEWWGGLIRANFLRETKNSQKTEKYNFCYRTKLFSFCFLMKFFVVSFKKFLLFLFFTLKGVTTSNLKYKRSQKINMGRKMSKDNKKIHFPPFYDHDLWQKKKLKNEKKGK